MEPRETIHDTVDAVSFDETLGEIGRVITRVMCEDQTIPVNSIAMYEVIAEFGCTFRADRAVRLITKYKTVDRKVRQVEAPLLENI